MTTGRYVYQYHTGTMTRKCRSLETGADMFGPAVVEIGFASAKKLGIMTGDYVKVYNDRGEIAVKARVMNRIKDNYIFGSFHYWEANVNELTNPSGLDPVCKIPELKVSAVNVVKITEAEYLKIQGKKREQFQSDHGTHNINRENIMPVTDKNNSLEKGA
ncbi:MAG TPA: molybdopterin dinucleotide binding domain-containing protein [Spirochaetota bacterium]|nr:molybdopterin dinucleotide binding domain-containing protein [Spirochaetota bacterium]HRX47559.1 molybdopterin dinucleotide binding domain-containing protein [Spirochaetota bacterium]